jgi:hypothetical protein
LVKPERISSSSRSSSPETTSLRAQLLADPHQRRIEPEPGLDANRQQVERVGEILEDRPLTLGDAARQDEVRQVVADPGQRDEDERQQHALIGEPRRGEREQRGARQRQRQHRLRGEVEPGRARVAPSGIHQPHPQRRVLPAVLRHRQLGDRLRQLDEPRDPARAGRAGVVRSGAGRADRHARAAGLLKPALQVARREQQHRGQHAARDEQEQAGEHHGMYYAQVLHDSLESVREA